MGQRKGALTLHHNGQHGIDKFLSDSDRIKSEQHREETYSLQQVL